MDVFAPDKWKTLSPKSQQAFIAFRHDNPEQAGWRWYALAAHSLEPAALARQSLVGFENLKLAPGQGRWIAVPAWLVAAVLALLPLYRLQPRRSTSRLPRMLTVAL